MAKTGDASDRKSKPKPRSRGARPSFAQQPAPAASSAWVYRSDAADAPAAPAAKPPVKPPVPAASTPIAAAPIATAAVPVPVKTAAKPAVKPVAAAKGGAREPVAAAPSAAARPSRVVHALDVVTLPIAVSLMVVLAPVRWLLGPSSRL